MQHAGPRAGRLNFTANEQPRIELSQRDRDHGQNVAADCTVVLRTNRADDGFVSYLFPCCVRELFSPVA
jgi:hypothetical protein